MTLDMILALACAGVAGATLAFLSVRALLKATSDVHEGSSPVRSMLALPAAFVVRRRELDPELRRVLERLDKLVVQSGGKCLDGATSAEIFAARFVFPLFALVFVLPIGLLLKLSAGLIFLMVVAVAALLYAYPEAALKSAAESRTRAFTRDLPASLDVMRLVAQSGGDLLSAVRSVVAVTPPGPVREELARALGEVAIGTSLSQALNNIAARIDTHEANAVFSTLSQSLEMGTSVAENLQGASTLIRHAARVRASAQAQKAVVNMSFPLLLLILPGIFIVLFAPLVIQFMNR